MASFSFGAGNASKLARIPLYLCGRIATTVLPRGRGWVFGCGAGIGDGPLALWRVAQHHGIDAVWLVENDRDAADAHAAGITTVRKHSLAGFLATARASVLVISHGFGDVNRYAVSGGFVAQLWHGIPLKRIGLDSPETTRFSLLPRSRFVPRLLGALYRLTASGISVIPAASHLVRGRLESAFALPDSRVIVTGEPRVDVLSQGDPAERRRRARASISDLVGETSGSLVLYAPTWRDGADDPAVPSAADWERIIGVLDKHDATLLVRSHPLGAGAYAPPARTDRVRMIGSDVVRDVTPLLSGMDALITDYSSLAFDAALVPLPTLFLAPDVDAYAHTRGFYGRFDDVARGDAVETWAQLMPRLDAVLGDDDEHAAKVAAARELSATVHDFRDGANTERVYREIVRRVTSRQKGRR